MDTWDHEFDVVVAGYGAAGASAATGEMDACAAVGAFGRAYLSGLSLADCVFSGRSAGREAAQGADG